MKAMKKLIYCLSMIFVIISCEKGGENHENQETQEVREDQIVLSDQTKPNQTVDADQTEAGGITFTAKSSWTATVRDETHTYDVDWLRLILDGNKIDTGTAGTFTLSFKLTPNDTGVERTAIIIIKSNDSDIAIGVLQKCEVGDGNPFSIKAEGRAGTLSWKLESGYLEVNGMGSIPDYLIGGSPWHYYYDDFNKAAIGEGVTGIGNYAFSECMEMTDIKIPNSVTTIGNGAFYSCYSLTEINIPNTVTKIGEEAFAFCTSLTDFTIPDNVTEIEWGAFKLCIGLTNFTIPENIVKIGGYAFHGCTFSNITISNGVTEIGNRAFFTCDELTNVTIPNSVKEIEEAAFSECVKLVSVTLPNDITRIKYASFSGCSSLTTINIPGRVTHIEEYAFYGCKSLTNITIPGNVAEIGEFAFAGCIGLSQVMVEAIQPPVVGKNGFAGIHPSTPVYVRAESLQAYKDDPNWNVLNLQVKN